jgi:hypothetical protein
MPTNDGPAIPPRGGGSSQTQTPPRATQSAPRAAQTATPHDAPTGRKRAVLELLALPMIPLAGMAAIETVKAGDLDAVSPYAMDVFTLQMHSDMLADAVVGLADNYPVLGAMLDKLAVATPFGAVFTAVVTIGMQIAENHGALGGDNPIRAVVPNLVPREEFAAQILAQGKAARQAARSNGQSV